MVAEEQRNILMVEDEVLISLMWKKKLESYNYNVVCSTKGEKAVSILDEDKSVDLVLMDIDLGNGIDGISAAKQILKKKELPVVFVSSHTEPEIIQQTESVTSYGYIVKGSNAAVYDASIKMAFKLFESKKESDRIEKILKTSLDKMEEAVFIADSQGNFIEFNNAWAEIQRFSSKEECLRSIFDYPDLYDVYTAEGRFAELEDWALPRALKGEHKIDVKYYIIRKDINDIWIGHYTFGPIIDNEGKLLGAVVIVKRVTEQYSDDAFLNELISKRSGST